MGWRRPILPDSCLPRGQIRLPTVDNTRFASSRANTFGTTPLSRDVSYVELKQIVEGRNKAVIIDVREPWELREYGSIPGSVNVPLGQINTALRLDAEEFEEKYGSEMPQLNDSIV